MTHRALGEIDADITAASVRLDNLYREMRDARTAEHEAICRLFDAGLSAAEIARARRANKSTVTWVLWKQGRTVKARTARRRQIDSFVREGK
jgi:hypothetical protein